MIRHSLNQFLLQLKHKREQGFDMEIFGSAVQYLNSLDFHKRLRISFCNFICSDFEKILAVLYRGERFTVNQVILHFYHEEDQVIMYSKINRDQLIMHSSKSYFRPKITTKNPTTKIKFSRSA